MEITFYILVNLTFVINIDFKGVLADIFYLLQSIVEILRNAEFAKFSIINLMSDGGLLK